MNNPQFHILGDLSVEQFLRDYWQKKPLLLRDAFQAQDLPITPDELAGLACEEEIESRIILQHIDDQESVLRRGPFSEQDFTQLPGSHWTLLVQAVDQWVPEVRELLNEFRFIPDWRLDDIMISYATEGGGVGPHYDNYDVFLIQAAGQKQWQTGQRCDDNTPLQPHSDLKILSTFVTENDFHLNPGDMLYLPPSVAHWGTASSNNCMTISIGFRAPSHAEMISDYGHWLSDNLSDFLRYSDTDLTFQVSPAEITHESIARVQRILREYADNPALVAQWFGRLMTEPKYTESAMNETEDLNCYLMVATDARLAWHQSGDQQTLYLFANGEDYRLPFSLKDRVKTLCDGRYYSAQQQRTSTTVEERRWEEVLTELLDNNVLIPTQE
ncbi:MAG: cupin domain-containing protein [Endozoicomonadaceae bacterium]|nr:cupin domain-containing protein [Endozoicomonadaceae bacterium]